MHVLQTLLALAISPHLRVQQSGWGVNGWSGGSPEDTIGVGEVRLSCPFQVLALQLRAEENGVLAWRRSVPRPLPVVLIAHQQAAELTVEAVGGPELGFPQTVRPVELAVVPRVRVPQDLGTGDTVRQAAEGVTLPP